MTLEQVGLILVVTVLCFTVTAFLSFLVTVIRGSRDG